MSDRTPEALETGVMTQAQLLRAVADLLERHAPDLPASDWHHVYFWQQRGGLSRERIRRILAALVAAGRQVRRDADDFSVVFKVGPAEVDFKFDKWAVAERRVVTVEREDWALIPVDDGGSAAGGDTPGES
jgi:hypothetical protein